MLLALGQVTAQESQHLRFEAFDEVRADMETDCSDAFITETAEDTLSMLVFTEKKKVYIVVYVYRFTGATEFVYNDQLHTIQIPLASLEDYIDESGFYYCFVLELGALKEYANEANNEVQSKIGLITKSKTVFTTRLSTTLQNGVKIAQYP
jgi:hypothetical protein